MIPTRGMALSGIFSPQLSKSRDAPCAIHLSGLCPEKAEQMTFEDFNQSCGMKLDVRDEWIVAAGRVDWAEVEKGHARLEKISFDAYNECTVFKDVLEPMGRSWPFRRGREICRESRLDRQDRLSSCPVSGSKGRRTD